MRWDCNTRSLSISRLPRSLVCVCLSSSSVLSAQLPVSYGRQIAPLFALYCTGCHGISNPSSNFRVTQFAALRAGGDIGDDIVPGRPDSSVLVHLIEGRRGPRQRMPQDSAPLSSSQIALVRRWISEGAHNDAAESPCFEMRIPNVSLSSSAPLEIGARILSPAFLTLILRSSLPSRDLYLEEASVNMPRERANIAGSGDWIHWRLVRQQDWPSFATLILRLQYSSDRLDGTVLSAITGGRSEQRVSNMSSWNCPPP
jgi:hypothetical protein